MKYIFECSSYEDLKLLRSQLTIIIENYNPYASVPNFQVDDLDLCIRTRNILKANAIYNLPEILAKPISYYKSLNNMGRRSLHELTELLNKMGYELKT